MQERTHVATTTPWSARAGYSRAVRVGHHIFVAGTGALTQEGTIEHPRDAAAQARCACRIIKEALTELDAGPEHVVRTRIYLRRAEDWVAVAEAHDECFGEARPVTTILTGLGFLHPAILVEIEAEAEV